MKPVEGQRQSDVLVSEPLTTSLALSTLLHGGLVLCILGGAWLWGKPEYYKPPTYTVALVDAPLTIQQPPPAERTRTSTPSKPQPPKPTPRQQVPADSTRAATKAPTPAKAEEPSTQGMQLPTARTQATKPTPPKEQPQPKAAAKKRPAPQVAAAPEARSAVTRLRQRQQEREAQQQRAEQERRQAAAESVAALRARLTDQTRPGEDSAATRLQQIRLQSYQAYVRDKIIEAWIIPLPPKERRGLQATAFLLVRRDGHVEHVHIVQSSQNKLFDASLLQAIHRAMPLPELPKEYPAELLEVEMRFSDRES